MQQIPPRQTVPAPSSLPDRTVVPHPSMQQVPPHPNVPVQPGRNTPDHPAWGKPVPGFHPHQSPPPHWREGYWRHVEHNGRLGWWWVTGPTWYFFPVPVYPYPNYPYPSGYDEAAPPPDSAAPGEGTGTQYWYFCESAQDYYPYIQDCPEDWQLVPVTPEDAPGVDAPSDDMPGE